MSEARLVRITPKDGGTATIEVDGRDVTGVVQALTVQMAAGVVPVVSLRLPPGPVDVELTAYVRELLDPVDVVDPETIRQQILDEIAAVDAGQLEAAALQRIGGLDGDPSTGAAFLGALVEMLR